jgi:hypothetical protein
MEPSMHTTTSKLRLFERVKLTLTVGSVVRGGRPLTTTVDVGVAFSEFFQ